MITPMCGIAGIIRIGGGEIPQACAHAMLAAQAHRGPDGQGAWREDSAVDGQAVHVAMAHVRMAILDIAGGAQPMVSTARRQLGPRSEADMGMNLASHRQGLRDDATLTVVFNGCIYNHRALRAELAGLGATFRTDHSDTEVLLEGHRYWGDDLPARLEGMFAYALWDSSARTLTLARDRCGEKPLYWWRGEAGAGGQTVMFASTVPALLAGLRSMGEAADLQVDAEQLRSGLIYGYQAVNSPWASVFEVPRAGFVRIDFSKSEPEAVTRRKYWMGTQGGTRARLLPMSVDRADELLRAAVRARLEADVPLGCFLSGGVDSSLIAHYAQEALAERGETLKTFTLRMPETDYDESQFAETAASHLGTLHTTLDCALDPAKDLVNLIEQLGTPFGDASILPTHWVSREARKHVKVALAGDGGDELFLGYERYKALSSLQRWGWLLSLIPTWAIPPGPEEKSLRAKASRLVLAARFGGYPDLVRVFRTPEVVRVFGAEAGQKLSRYRQVDLALDHDFRNYLPGDLLRKVDTASMAIALEVRCPFLDTALMEAALSTAPGEIMRGGQTKGLLKQVALRYLPATLVNRPKMGFALPIGRWLREDYGGLKGLLELMFAQEDAFAPLEIRPAHVAWLVREHMEAKCDHTHRLFGLMTLAIWNVWRRKCEAACLGVTVGRPQ